MKVSTQLSIAGAGHVSRVRQFSLTDATVESVSAGPGDDVQLSKPAPAAAEPTKAVIPQPVAKPTAAASAQVLPPQVSMGCNKTLFMEDPALTQPAPPAPTFTIDVARATLREELGDTYAKEYEIFYHGSSSGKASLEDHLPKGKVFSSASLDTAELFAHRKTNRVPGRPTMTAIAIPTRDFVAARNLGYVTTKGIDDMPGKIETIFNPHALARFATFIPIPEA